MDGRNSCRAPIGMYDGINHLPTVAKRILSTSSRTAVVQVNSDSSQMQFIVGAGLLLDNQSLRRSEVYKGCKVDYSGTCGCTACSVAVVKRPVTHCK